MYSNLQGLLEKAKLDRIHSQRFGGAKMYMSVYVESECDQNSDFESCSKKHRCFEGVPNSSRVRKSISIYIYR